MRLVVVLGLGCVFLGCSNADAGEDAARDGAVVNGANGAVVRAKIATSQRRSRDRSSF